MNTKQSFGLILILLLVFGMGFWVGGGTETKSTDTQMDKMQTHDGKMAKERKISHWRGPMNPNYISDKPGKSPMGMDLIPVYEDEVMDSGSVTVDPSTVQNIGVKTETVARKPLIRAVRTVGRVDYDETRVTDINTKVAGWVEKLFVDYTGQVVKKGDPLLEIYSPELVAAQEEYLTALENKEKLSQNQTNKVSRGARDLLDSTKQRLLHWDITEAQIAELEKTRKIKHTMILYSPQEGIVVHKSVLDGAHIKSGQHLYRIAKLDRVWVYADIYEYEMPWIEEGQEAEVALPAAPGKTLRGKVIFVYPFLEPKTRTVRVRMEFPNLDRSLKPEMYASVEIRPVVTREAVVIPTQAVIHSGKRSVVILSLGDGRFQPREVQLGVEADDVHEVVDGLVGGEEIVTSAHFLIDSESNLKAALAEMGGTKPSGHSH